MTPRDLVVAVPDPEILVSPPLRRLRSSGDSRLCSPEARFAGVLTAEVRELQHESAPMPADAAADATTPDAGGFTEGTDRGSQGWILRHPEGAERVHAVGVRADRRRGGWGDLR